MKLWILALSVLFIPFCPLLGRANNENAVFEGLFVTKSRNNLSQSGFFQKFLKRQCTEHDF
jgi:hypothetical protein